MTYPDGLMPGYSLDKLNPEDVTTLTILDHYAGHIAAGAMGPLFSELGVYQNPDQVSDEILLAHAMFVMRFASCMVAARQAHLFGSGGPS